MNIDEAIGVLKQFKRLGVTDVLIPRDFCPGGDFTFKFIPTPPDVPKIAWVVEVEDDYTRMRDRALESEVFNSAGAE